MGGGADTEEQVDEVRANTEQLKRLNDYLGLFQMNAEAAGGGGGGGGGSAPQGLFSGGTSGGGGIDSGGGGGGGGVRMGGLGGLPGIPGPGGGGGGFGGRIPGLSGGGARGGGAEAPGAGGATRGDGFTGLGGGAFDQFTTSAKAKGALAAPDLDAFSSGTARPSAGGGGRAVTGGGAIYQKLLEQYKNSNLVGTIPPDGARFGFKTGSAEEWARFGTAVASAESSFNPKTKNLSDPGGSFGVFQYAHGQVPGGNAYDVDASVKAFVRDSESSIQSGRGLRGGILGARFSTIGSHPGRTAAHLAEAERIGESVTDDRQVIDRKSIKTVKVDATGKVAINIGAGSGGDATLGSQGLFKPSTPERREQMATADTGPKAATFSERFTGAAKGED
jgi:hypothetical protein